MGAGRSHRLSGCKYELRGPLAERVVGAWGHAACSAGVLGSPRTLMAGGAPGVLDLCRGESKVRAKTPDGRRPNSHRWRADQPSRPLGGRGPRGWAPGPREPRNQPSLGPGPETPYSEPAGPSELLHWDPKVGRDAHQDVHTLPLSPNKDADSSGVLGLGPELSRPLSGCPHPILWPPTPSTVLPSATVHFPPRPLCATPSSPDWCSHRLPATWGLSPSSWGPR